MVAESGGATAGTEANVALTASGWEAVPDSGQKEGNTRLTVLYRIATGTDVATGDDPTTTNDTGDRQMARIIGIKVGTFNTYSPFNTSAGGTQSSTQLVSIPGSTTTTDGCLILACASGDLPDSTSTAEFGPATNASLSNITELIDRAVNTGDGGALFAVSGIKSTAGAYGATTCTAVTSAARGVLSLAIAPPPVGLGVEYGCKYTLIGPDGTTVVFNDSSDPNFVGVLSPESSGLDSADVREDATDATEEDGGHHGDFFEGRRPVVLQGTIIASGAIDRNEKAEKLKRASRALRRDAILTWSPQGGSEVELGLRRQQPLRITKGYVKDFQLPMVAAEIYPKAVTNQTKSTSIESQKKFVTKFPGSQTQIHYGAFGDEEEGLFSPGTSGIQVEDGIYTSTASTPIAADQISLVGSNFGFAIPETATILGAEAGIKRRGFNGSAGGGDDFKDLTVQLIDTEAEPSTTGENKASSENWPEAAAWKMYGGRSDKWGASGTMTPARVNQSGANAFGFRLRPQRVSYDAGDKAEVDAFKLTLYYEEAAAPTNTVSCTNNGDMTAWPTVTIKGYIENPIITNSTTGEQIQLEVVIPEGQSLVIDFKNHAIKLNGAYAYDSLVFANSEWWGIEPGANTIAVSGEYGTATAELEVAWQDTFI
jgi:hypothetical protein